MPISHFVPQYLVEACCARDDRSTVLHAPWAQGTFRFASCFCVSLGKGPIHREKCWDSLSEKILPFPGYPHWGLVE